MIHDHFLDDVFERSSHDQFIEECVPVMIDRTENGATDQGDRPNARPIDGQIPLPLFDGLAKGSVDEEMIFDESYADSFSLQRPP